MNIFIDESGIFANPEEKDHTISSVVALIIPESQFPSVEKNYTALKALWGLSQDEIKGGQLDEEQLSELLNLLLEYDIIAELSAIDIGLHDEHQVSKHKIGQADNILKHIDSKRSPILYKNSLELRDNLKGLSNQLYLESCLVVEVCWRAVQTSTVYYCQRIPEELSKFNWIVDAKNEDLTSYEEYWLTVIATYIQSKSIADPFIHLSDCDYSHFQRFLRPAPDYLKEHISNLDEHAIYPDATKIFRESLTFLNSQDHIGLELSHIIANTLRRALMNNIKFNGWNRLGELMVSWKKSSLQFITIGNQPYVDIKSPPYYQVLNHLHKSARSAFL